MLTNTGMDQADGLRRLLPGNRTRLITVVGAKVGVGRTSMTINLAAALANSGKDVLVLDENQSPNNLSDLLLPSSRLELIDIAQARCTLKQVMQSSQGFSVLPGARAMRELAHLNSNEQQRLEQALAEASDGVDVMLVDAASLAGKSAVSSGLATGVSLLVVVDATASGITETYTMIKRLALENARLNFGIVVNRANSDHEAINVYNNMENVARRHLAARLEYLGYIPFDAKISRSTVLGRSVVTAFPASQPTKAYVELAQKLSLQPVTQDDAQGGISGMMHSLIRQIRGEEMAHAVN